MSPSMERTQLRESKVQRQYQIWCHLFFFFFFFTSKALCNLCALHFAGLVKAPLKRSRSTADGADEDSQELLQEQLLESGGPDEEQKTDNTSLLRLLEEGEKVR